MVPTPHYLCLSVCPRKALSFVLFLPPCVLLMTFGDGDAADDIDRVDDKKDVDFQLSHLDSSSPPE